MLPRYLVNLNPDKLKRIRTDYLVVGAGVAGLKTALELASDGEVTVLTKESFSETNTKYAQGGIAAPWSNDDSPKLHFEDTIEAGAGLCNSQAVEILVRQAREQIKKLAAWGVDFDQEAGDFALTKEGGHSKARVLHAGGDATGKEINTTLAQQAQANPQIKGEDSSFVLDLITDGGACYGAYVYDKKRDEHLIYQARAVILATGGSGQLYSFTSNPQVATSDGIAIAYRAGAEVMDLEMMQFHPTVLNLEDVEAFLISEAVRGEGAKLRRTDGTRFMPSYHQLAELAPRDIVARAIKQEIRKQDKDYIHLDLTELEIDFIKTRFPTIYKKCRAAGLEISQDYIPIKPAAHYFMGGIKIDIDARTNLQRLYACGEAACLGVHGANRLASNSLLEALVYGQRAAEKIKEADYEHITKLSYEDQGKKKADLELNSLRLDIQGLMMNYLGIIRDESGLKENLNYLEQKLDLLELELNGVEAWEVQNMLTTAYLMTKFALLRNESRGAHYRSDYPKSQKDWQKHIVMQRQKKWRIESLE